MAGEPPAVHGGGVRRYWAGAGGRWVLWPLRTVLWAAILVVAYRGITAIVFGQATGRPSIPVAPPARQQFPVVLAEAYALAFGQVYLNASPATRVQREQQLAAFVPPAIAAADPDLGWNGTGQLRLQSEQVAAINVKDGSHAVVDVLATVSGQLMELGVPVYAAGGAVAVSGPPAWLGAPPPAAAPATQARSTDNVAQDELMNQLPAFFQAYANGSANALNRFLAPGVTLTGLNGSVTFAGISNLVVPRGGPSRDITVTVVWQVLGQNGLTNVKLASTYGVSVVDLQSGKWYVKGISAATEVVGAQ